jgi:hypothetical protein
MFLLLIARWHLPVLGDLEGPDLLFLSSLLLASILPERKTERTLKPCATFESAALVVRDGHKAGLLAGR